MRRNTYITVGGWAKHLRVAAGIAVAASLWAWGPVLGDDETMNEILKNGTATSAPSGDIVPDTRPGMDPLGTVKAKSPRESRIANVVLNNGVKYEGQVWTTLQTPFRVWIEAIKQYRDVDLTLIKRVDVVVEYEKLEDDWRWLKEGSDQKVYSGKKYPDVSLAYKFTLLNDQVIEGPVVAPVWVNDGEKIHQFAFYKKYKGKLGETLKDVVYIKAIAFRVTDKVIAVESGKTTKLPLIED